MLEVQHGLLHERRGQVEGGARREACARMPRPERSIVHKDGQVFTSNHQSHVAAIVIPDDPPELGVRLKISAGRLACAPTATANPHVRRVEGERMWEPYWTDD